MINKNFDLKKLSYELLLFMYIPPTALKMIILKEDTAIIASMGPFFTSNKLMYIIIRTERFT